MQRQRFFQDPMLLRQQPPFGVPTTSFPSTPHLFNRQLSDGMAQIPEATTTFRSPHNKFPINSTLIQPTTK